MSKARKVQLAVTAALVAGSITWGVVFGWKPWWAR